MVTVVIRYYPLNLQPQTPRHPQTESCRQGPCPWKICSQWLWTPIEPGHVNFGHFGVAVDVNCVYNYIITCIVMYCICNMHTIYNMYIYILIYIYIYYFITYYIILYCTIVYYIILYFSIVYYSILYYIILYFLHTIYIYVYLYLYIHNYIYIHTIPNTKYQIQYTICNMPYTIYNTITLHILHSIQHALYVIHYTFYIIHYTIHYTLHYRHTYKYSICAFMIYSLDSWSCKSASPFGRGTNDGLTGPVLCQQLVSEFQQPGSW